MLSEILRSNVCAPLATRPMRNRDHRYTPIKTPYCSSIITLFLESVDRREYCHTGAELLNVGSHGPWSDRLQLQASLLAPVEELSDGDGIGLPGVPIADVRREELDEALAGAGAGRRDRYG